MQTSFRIFTKKQGVDSFIRAFAPMSAIIGSKDAGAGVQAQTTDEAVLPAAAAKAEGTELGETDGANDERESGGKGLTHVVKLGHGDMRRMASFIETYKVCLPTYAYLPCADYVQQYVPITSTRALMCQYIAMVCVKWLQRKRHVRGSIRESGMWRSISVLHNVTDTYCTILCGDTYRKNEK
jgi:hypothetical protein